MTDPTLKLNVFSTYLKELEQTVTRENTLVHPFLPHINSLLHNAVLTCRAASTDINQTAFKGEKIAPGKKIEHQWCFKKTTNTPGRKKKGTVLRYMQ